MSAMPAQEQDWQAEAIDLKRNGLESKEIGEVLGKHPATVRKVIAAAREAGVLPEPFAPDEGESAEDAEPIPGQVDIDGNVAGEDVPPEDDPEYEPPESIVWTGENKTEVAVFLGRGENGTIHARNIDLPTMDGGIVRARPGDTIVRVGENAYEVHAGERDPLDDFKREAGEPVGPMPPSRAVDPQDGLFDKQWEDADLEAALEAREATREAKLSASKAHKLKNDEAKALLEKYELAVGEVARIGRFRIKKTRSESKEVSFVTDANEQLRIAVDRDD